MSRDAWLAAHPYLQPLADFSAQVDRTLARIDVPAAVPVEWDSYRPDYVAGVPLLASGHAAVDLAPGAGIALTTIERLQPIVAHDRLSPELRALSIYLQETPNPQQRVVDLLLGGDTSSPPFPGLLRYVAWAAMARYLRPVLAAFDLQRDDEQWHRGYCPGCGSLPAMAQLVGVDHGRKRLLACGCCGMRWQFKRTTCPFCEAESPSLATVKVETEPALRIDHCATCSAYLKTYEGQGDEALMLADWSSLHLDLVAQDRGLKRMSPSLYELEATSLPQLT